MKLQSLPYTPCVWFAALSATTGIRPPFGANGEGRPVLDAFSLPPRRYAAFSVVSPLLHRMRTHPPYAFKAAAPINAAFTAPTRYSKYCSHIFVASLSAAPFVLLPSTIYNPS